MMISHIVSEVGFFILCLALLYASYREPADERDAKSIVATIGVTCAAAFLLVVFLFDSGVLK